jgi:hypothetical protein
MLARVRALLVIALLSCEPKQVPAKRRFVDATAFRHMIAEHDERLGKLEIVPVGRNTARYIIHASADRRAPDLEVDAEYPGRLVDAITAAHVAYTVSSPDWLDHWPRSEREMDAVTVDALHDALADKDAAAQIEVVFVEPLDKSNARYRVRWKSRPRESAVTAPFPGALVDELVAAEIPYGVRLSGD